MFKKKNMDDLTFEDLYAPNWQIFAFLSVLNFLITFWAHKLIFTKEIYYSLLSDQMEIVRIDEFVEVGPGRVLQGLIRRINRDAVVSGIGTLEQVEALS